MAKNPLPESIRLQSERGIEKLGLVLQI